MQFGRSIMSPEEMEFQIQGSWIPATPSKPEQMSRHVQPHWVETESVGRSCGNGLFQENGCRNETSSSFAADTVAKDQFRFMDLAYEMQEIGNLEAAVAAQTRVSGLNAYAEAFGNANDMWNKTSFERNSTLAGTASTTATQIGGNAVSSFMPISYSQNASSNQGGPNLMNLNCMNQNRLLGFNLQSNSNCPPQMPQYGFPVPYHATNNLKTNYTSYHLNTPAKAIADAVTNGSMSFHLAPETPDKGRRQMSSQAAEFSVVDERINQEHTQKATLHPAVMPPLGMEPIKVCDEQALSKPVGIFSTPVKESHNPSTAEDQIDLNKTPQQKRPKRKKHMPKVIVEDRPKRTPKPVTPNKDIPLQKKQHMQSSSPKASMAAPSDLGETVGPAGTQDIKSCKRALNFNLEGQSQGGCSGMTEVHQDLSHNSMRSSSVAASHTWAFDHNQEVQDECAGIDCNSGPKSTVQLAQGLEAVVRNSLSGTLFDLNSSFIQLPDDNCSLPDNPSLSPSLGRKELLKKNAKVLARKKENGEMMGVFRNNRDSIHIPAHQNVHAEERNCVISHTQSACYKCEKNAPLTLQNVLQSVTGAQSNSSGSPHLMPVKINHSRKGLKREHGHTFNSACLRPTILFGARNTQSSNIYKKRRTDTGQNVVTSDDSLVMAWNGGIRQETTNGVNGIGSNTFMLLASDGRPFPLCNILEGRKATHEVISNMESDVHSHFMAGEHNRMLPNASREMLLPVGTQNGTKFNRLQVLTETMTKARAKENIQVCDFASLVAATKVEQLPPASAKAALTYNHSQDANVFHDTQTCMQALVTANNRKMATQKCMKMGLTQLPSSVSSPSTNQVLRQEHETVMHDYRQSFAKSVSTSLHHNCVMLAAISSKHLQPRTSNINFIPDCPRSRYGEWKPHSRLQGAMIPLTDPMDKFDHRMECTNINTSSKIITAEAQNALVPFVRDGKLVPYEGPVDPKKGRPPRPTVVVDTETTRLWNILMGNVGSETPDAMDPEKDKWWEEERRVFQGRTDSFIARMHLIQGDRRFSPWKGSVVDSVVGVFLTQNVSDHLSSSAFMNLAARFPPKSRTDSGASYGEGKSISTEEQHACILDADKWQNDISRRKVHNEHPTTLNEAEPSEEKEAASCNESCASNMEVCPAVPSNNKHSSICENEPETWQESQEMTTNAPLKGTESAGLEDTNYRTGPEDVVSSQLLVISSQDTAESTVQKADQTVSVLESSSEEDNLIPHFNGNMSFMKLLQMGGVMFQEFYPGRNWMTSSKENFEGATSQFEGKTYDKGTPYFGVDGPSDSCPSVLTTDSHLSEAQNRVNNVLSTLHSGQKLHRSMESGSVELVSAETSKEESLYSLPSTVSKISEITETSDNYYTGKRISPTVGNAAEIMVPQRLLSTAQTAPPGDPSPGTGRKHVVLSPNSAPEDYVERNHIIPLRERSKVPSGDSTSSRCSHLQFEQTVNSMRIGREADYQSKSIDIAEHQDQVETMFNRQQSQMKQSNSNLPHHLGDSFDVSESSIVVDKQKIAVGNLIQLNTNDEAWSLKGKPAKTTDSTPKRRKEKSEVEKMKDFNWENLRKQVNHKRQGKESSSDLLDAVDWDAVRCADVKEISNAIKERGMNNMLAERIQEFLNRVVTDHGSLDLEWLRDVPPEKAKEYLLSIRGLGLKSTECVRLLTLHHVAFPVDTNVGRVSVRLGWVPLQPLPESLQIHLLEQYPVLASVQKYLWPRLCTLDQRTLYELHYQMITFGKVFCTKKNPNCNACPMRADCKHFASAFASARLALPGPEEKSLVSSATPAAEQDQKVDIHLMSLPSLEGNLQSQAEHRSTQCEPIIEEPATPEPACIDASENEIEDAFWQEDPDDIPTIKLNLEEFTLNVQNYMHENSMGLQDVDFSKALVALSPQAASIPMPKLKNVVRLRTEHQVYELPDSHPLLAELDRREPDDPCSYLLAIWTPGETEDSIEPPGICCNSQESGNLCDQRTCFSCNSIRERNSQTVRGTLLIPCRTAMRGRFPLNGTYFQVNEVFADHESSIQPIDVPRAWIWNLPRRTVYFGTSVPTIFRGLTTEGIQQCFWRGFVCVRGFDRKSRAPRPLTARQHLPASKLVRLKRTEHSMARDAQGSITNSK